MDDLNTGTGDSPTAGSGEPPIPDPEASQLPRERKNAWKLVYVLLASLAVIALVLSMIYRQTTKPSQVLQKERIRNATRTMYSVVFSKVNDSAADSIVNIITSEVGADSMKTDLVLGTTVTDPWVATVGEYRSMLHKAMRETEDLPIGKQTLIISKVAGIMLKNNHPSVVYLIGTLNAADLKTVGRRTEQSASAMMNRSKLMGPVRIVSLLQPPDSPVHQEYIGIYKRVGLDVTE